MCDFKLPLLEYIFLQMGHSIFSKSSTSRLRERFWLMVDGFRFRFEFDEFKFKFEF